MALLLLFTAVAANIFSNVMFKQAMSSFPEDANLASLISFIGNPYLWAGGLSCVLMLACYLLAIREIGLGVTYAFVTSLSLIGITAVAAFTFKEAVSVQAGIGICLVIGGILLISGAARSTISPVTAVQPSELPPDKASEPRANRAAT